MVCHNSPDTSVPASSTAETQTFTLELSLTDHAVRGPAGSLPLAAGDTLARDFLLLLARETAQLPMRRLLASFGYCSRATYYDKLNRYLAGGLEGLSARAPGPRRKWRRSEEAIKSIVAYKFRHPACGASEIVDMLASRGFSMSLRSVQRTLTEYGLSNQRG